METSFSESMLRELAGSSGIEIGDERRLRQLLTFFTQIMTALQKLDELDLEDEVSPDIIFSARNEPIGQQEA